MYENPPVSTMRNCGYFWPKTPLVVAVLSCQPNQLWMQKIAIQPICEQIQLAFFRHNP
jgi:hypothetical protein